MTIYDDIFDVDLAFAVLGIVLVGLLFLVKVVGEEFVKEEVVWAVHCNPHHHSYQHHYRNHHRHHICQKIYATAIFGPKNLRKKSVNRDKIEFATKWRKCYKMTLKRENGQLTLYHHLFGNCQFCTTVHGI